MSVLDDILPIRLDCALEGKVGTYNCTNPGVITHNEIWENFSIEEQNTILASKRSNNYLDTRKLEGIATIPDIKTSIRNVLLRMKNNNK